MGMGSQPKTAAAGLAPWMGGKRRLAKRIIERLERIPHQCYAEPFVGMGGVFLRRKMRPKVEALNDRNGEIMNLFRIVRDHPDELKRQFRWALTSRGEFKRLVVVPTATLTDIQRAARFAFLQHMTFGGKPAHMASPSDCRAQPTRVPTFGAAKIMRRIESAHHRLQNVFLEDLDWTEFIPRYDRHSTLFYVDPPYWGNEKVYGEGLFAQADFVRLSEMLRGLRGQFLLSLNDRPEVRELFRGFKIETVNTYYSVSPKAEGFTDELLISNYSVRGRRKTKAA